MGWFSYEEQYPEGERIVCFDELTGEVFNMDWMETKWGNYYRDENYKMRSYTHWRPREQWSGLSESPHE